MTTPTSARPRARLNRDQIYRSGLEFVDAHGLEALSLHKLGEALGVRAMSLYNHIGGKDDLLSGITACLWCQVEERGHDREGWRTALEQTSRTIREVIFAHPSASCLLVTRPGLPEPAVRVMVSLVDVLREAGFGEDRAIDVVRLFVSHAIGTTLAEICWLETGGSSQGRPDPAIAVPAATESPTEASDPLVRVAVKLCGECDPQGVFDLGLELMLRGLEPGG